MMATYLSFTLLVILLFFLDFVNNQVIRSTATCSVSLCPSNNATNSSCSSANTKTCYAYTIASTNKILCGPSVSCSLFEPCVNNTVCSSSSSVCLSGTCCSQPICMPLSLAAITCNMTMNTTSTTTPATIVTNSSTASTLLTYAPSTGTCNSTVATPCANTTSANINCQSYEVLWNNRCYYLDGSGGNCTVGYTRATNAVLNCIASQFAGKTYRSTISNNCCIWTADTYQCYGFNIGCNIGGPFSYGPVFDGATCLNLQNRATQQLTFCGSI